MFKKIITALPLIFLFIFFPLNKSEAGQMQTCQEIRSDLIETCQVCTANINSSTFYTGEEIECRNLITPTAGENVQYFYDNVNCSNISRTSCQGVSNQPPKLTTSNSESFDLNDEETGITPAEEDSLLMESVRQNGPILGPIYVFINLLTGIIATLTILAIVIGSFLMITGRGDETQITRGKDIVKNSIIALVIVLSSYTIIRLVQATIFQLINQ